MSRSEWGQSIQALMTAGETEQARELIRALSGTVGLDLSGVNLRGCPLRGLSLRGADLSGANLDGADLTDADLRDATLSGARLFGTRLGGANLMGAVLEGTDVQFADLRGANLGNITVSTVTPHHPRPTGPIPVLQSAWRSVSRLMVMDDRIDSYDDLLPWIDRVIVDEPITAVLELCDGLPRLRFGRHLCEVILAEPDRFKRMTDTLLPLEIGLRDALGLPHRPELPTTRLVLKRAPPSQPGGVKRRVFVRYPVQLQRRSPYLKLDSPTWTLSSQEQERLAEWGEWVRRMQRSVFARRWQAAAGRSPAREPLPRHDAQGRPWAVTAETLLREDDPLRLLWRHAYQLQGGEWTLNIGLIRSCASDLCAWIIEGAPQAAEAVVLVRALMLSDAIPQDLLYKIHAPIVSYCPESIKKQLRSRELADRVLRSM